MVAGARLVGVCAALMWVAAVAAQGPSATERIAARISQQDFKQLFAAKAVAIVDTRDEDSFRHGRIPGVLRLPLELAASDSPEGRQIVARLKASKPPVVVYCACSGETSSLRLATLLSASASQMPAPSPEAGSTGSTTGIRSRETKVYCDALRS